MVSVSVVSCVLQRGGKKTAGREVALSPLAAASALLTSAWRRAAHLLGVQLAHHQIAEVVVGYGEREVGLIALGGALVHLALTLAGVQGPLVGVNLEQNDSLATQWDKHLPARPFAVHACCVPDAVR